MWALGQRDFLFLLIISYNDVGLGLSPTGGNDVPENGVNR